MNAIANIRERFIGAAGADLGVQRNLAAWRGLGRAMRHDDPRQIRAAAGQLVSQLFFAPMLAEARKLPLGKGIGGGGRGEEVFGEQLDQRLADTLAATARIALTRKIESKLAPRGTAEPAPVGRAPYAADAGGSATNAAESAPARAAELLAGLGRVAGERARELLASARPQVRE